MEPYLVRLELPRQGNLERIRVEFEAGFLTLLVGPDGSRRDLLVDLIRQVHRIPEILGRVRPEWIRAAPMGVAGELLGRSLPRIRTTCSEGAFAQWGPSQFRLWGIGADEIRTGPLPPLHLMENPTLSELSCMVQKLAGQPDQIVVAARSGGFASKLGIPFTKIIIPTGGESGWIDSHEYRLGSDPGG